MKTTEDTKCLSKSAQKALALGLLRDEINDHNWDDPENGDTGTSTIEYLKKHRGHLSPLDAMNNIRGLTSKKLSEVLKATFDGINDLKLTADQVYIQRVISGI